VRAVVVDPRGRERVPREEDPRPLSLDEEPAVVEGLPREVARGHAESAPRPRLAILGHAIDARLARRDARDPPGDRIRDHLRDRAIGIAGTIERLLELRDRIDVIVVVVRDPEPLDRADRFVREPTLQVR